MAFESKLYKPLIMLNLYFDLTLIDNTKIRILAKGKDNPYKNYKIIEITIPLDIRSNFSQSPSASKEALKVIGPNLHANSSVLSNSDLQSDSILLVPN